MIDPNPSDEVSAMPSDLRKINQKECVGCRICELVCSLKHYGVINPRPRIQARHCSGQLSAPIAPAAKPSPWRPCS